MGLFDQFPYTNFHELNLDWILKALKELEHTIEQFVAINALKYADPIQWNITSQYEKNTIVIDPQSGTAYISVQPVPSGVALTNEDYWTVVFDLGQFVVRASKNFANTYEAETTLTATVSTAAGGWIVWGDTLYKALVNITAGDSYVIGGNIAHFTMEDIIGHLEDLTTTDKSNVVAAINEVAAEVLGKIGDLADLTTTDKSNLVAAINEVLNTSTSTTGDLADLTTTDKSNLVAAINEVLNTSTSTTGDLADLTTTDKSNLVSAINEVNADIDNVESLLMYFNVKKYGAKGDGSTDDTDAFKAAILAAKTNGGGIIFVPSSNDGYVISDTLTLNGKLFVLGEGISYIKFSNSILFKCYDFYGGIKDIHAYSTSGTGTFCHFDLVDHIAFKWRFEHIEVENCAHAFDDTGIDSTSYIVDMVFDDILCTYCNGDQFVSRRSRGFMTLHNCKVDYTFNTSLCPYTAYTFIDVIGLEMEKVDSVGPVARNVSPVFTPAQTGIKIIGTTDGHASVWLSRINIDTTYGNGITINGVDYVQGDLIECFGNWGYGFDITDCKWFALSNVYLVNSSATTETENSGLILVRCTWGIVTNLTALDWKGRGLILNDSNKIMVTGGIINHCGIAGVQEIGTSNSNIFANLGMENNTAHFSIVGVQSRGVNVNLDGIYTATVTP